MLVLGFSNSYYTLWEVSEPYKKYSGGMVLNGVFTGSFEMVQDCIYLQNLSLDYNEALKKITERSGNKFRIELELRGHTRWTRSTGINGNDMPINVFSFGNFKGESFETCTNVWQLKRAMNEEFGGRRRVLARRRLIDLGELIRYKGKYMTQKQIDFYKAKELEASLTGHYFEDGKRIKLTIKKIGGFNFEGQFGTTYVEKYLTEDGKLVKYMGGTPPDISEEEFMLVTATIHHDEYKGIKETKLKRIKLDKKYISA